MQVRNPPKHPPSRHPLVLVPVVIHKSGAHSGGLKKGSFTVLQDEQPQEIAIFEEVHPPAPTATSPAEQESRFSNTRANQDAERLTIIAVDLVNTAPLDQLYLKKEIIKFLEAAAESGERYALIAITTSGLHVLQDFTTDPKRVVSAMSKEGAKATGSELTGSTGVAVFDQTPCADSVFGCGTRGNNLKGLKELQLWLNLYKTEESFEIFRDRNARLDTLSSLQQVGQAFPEICSGKCCLLVLCDSRLIRIGCEQQ
jgi:VWFA-related protein